MHNFFKEGNASRLAHRATMSILFAYGQSACLIINKKKENGLHTIIYNNKIILK